MHINSYLPTDNRLVFVYTHILGCTHRVSALVLVNTLLDYHLGYVKKKVNKMNSSSR